MLFGLGLSSAAALAREVLLTRFLPDSAAAQLTSVVLGAS